MSERLKLKLLGRSLLKGKVGAYFPHNITAELPIEIIQNGNNVELGFDMEYLVGQLPVSAVSGPGSSTDNAIVRWDGLGGTNLQNSGVIINDNDDVVIPSGSGLLWPDEGDIAIVAENSELTFANADLYFFDNDMEIGASGKIVFNERLAPAAADPDTIQLYAKDVGGVTHLFTVDQANTHTDITLGGSGTPGGANTQVQFNDGGVFGGDTDFTWNKTTNQLAFGSGSSIDFASGDVTITHSPNTLVISGASSVSIGIGGELTVGTIQLGNLADTTLSRHPTTGGIMQVEGQDVLTALTGQPLDSDLSAISNLVTNGLIARTGTGTMATRTLTFGGSAGLSISNGDGVAGSPTINLSNDLNALEALAGTNTIYYRSGVDTWSSVTIGANLTFSGGTLAASTGTAVVGDGTYQDIQVSGSGLLWNIVADAVGNVELANMAAATVKGQIVGGSGNPVDLTATQLVAIIATADGAGSGLDADLLDGNSSAFFATATDLSNHVSNPTGAHAATAISFTPTGNIAAVNVQTALVELDTEKQPFNANLTSWAAITRATGFDTFVATPTSANLAALVTGETGTGSLVFNTSPTLVTPVLGTPTSGTLTNCVGLPTILVANEAADTSCFPAFFTSATGELGPRTNANLTFNAATNVLAIAGSSVLTAASGIPVTNEATDTSCFLAFFTDATGNLAPKTNANMTFNSLTGVVTLASSVLTNTDINGGTVDGTVIGGAAPAAGTFTAAVANSFVPNSATVPTNGTYLPAVNTLGWAIAGNPELQLTGTAFSPAVDGGNSLGTTTLGWQNLFGNTGFVWNIENGDWVATHTAGVLTVGTGDLRITTAGTNAASVVTVGGTQTLTNKTIAAGSNTITGLTTTSIAAATLVDAADTIALNDNDTTWPTTAAVIDYAQPLDTTLNALAAFNTNGLLVQTAADTFAGRTLTAPAAGLTITNPAGTAGNPTFALANDLAALEALTGTNTIYYRSGVDTWTAVTIGANLSFTGGTLAASSGTATVGDGDYGDITVSIGGTVWTIDADAVSYAKMQNVSAASKLLGRGDSGAGDPQEITLGTGLTMTGTTLSSTGGSGAPTTAQYVVLALDATLTAERVLVAGGGLTLGDTGANGNATLAVGAGTGITVNADDVAIDTAVVARKSDNLSVFAATTSAQLAGVISDETGSGALVFATSPQLVTPQIQDTSSTNQYVFAVNELTANRTVTLPLLTGNDTFVFEAHTQTLTNKTIALGSNTISGTTAQFNTALSDGDFATLAGSETLTGKTINLGSNTLTGTTAQFNTALSDGDFATLAGTETLTNKTLTLPQINDTSSTNQYVFAVNELAANRTITLPLLTAGDTFVFEAHTQTLTNKTLTSPTIGGSPTAAGATWSNLGAVTTIDINGGTLDGVVIGGALAAAATITTLTSQTHLPATDGLYDLGSTTLAWNNLHLDTGATINIENGNWLATHTTGILTVGTGDLRVTTAGTNTASVVTVGGTQTLTGKSIDLTNNTLTGTAAQFNTALTGADFYTTGGTDVALADGGTGASLTAPSVDRLMMWDQGGATVAFGTTSNITTYASPTIGDFVLVQRASSDDLVKVDWASLPGVGGGAPSTASYLTLSLDGTLTAERVLTAGNGIGFTDGGANSTLTIAADAASTTEDGIVELATNAETLTGTDTVRAVTPDSLAALWERGSDIASAATISIGDGGYFHVTGTTTITDIDFATVPTNNGRPVILQFDAALTLTHNATTLVLPGGANITTAAGDCALIVQDGGVGGDNIKVVDYFRASGLPLDPTLAALGAYNTNGLLTQTAADTFTGRTITGTASRIAVSNGSGVAGNPTIDIDAAYVGQTSITTLGTITSGTWNGTDIAFANIAQGTARSVLGVTGNATADVASIQGTANQVLRVNAAGTALAFQSSAALTKTDDTNVTLTLGGTPTTALLDAVSITAGWTGQLSLSRGGTGASLSAPTVDRPLIWDQFSGAVKFAAIGDITTEGAPTSGDYLLGMDSTTDALVKIAWSSLPGVPITRTITSGGGLTGGGDLSADRTLAVGAGTGITVNADDVAITAATTTEFLTGTAVDRVVTPDSAAALWEKGTNVASAATVSLGEGGFFHITGTTTITDIDFATAKDGRTAAVVFDGALTLTHNGTTLDLPGNANITTVAGDVGIFVQDASDNIKCIAYQREANPPVIYASGIATFLGTPSSANLAAALTDETGSGAAVFAASPTLSGTIGGTLSWSGVQTYTDATDTSFSGASAALNLTGGMKISKSLFVEGSSAAGFWLGSGSGNRIMTINGANTGTGNGGNYQIDLAGSLLLALGNVSSINGTAYDGTALLKATTVWRWQVPSGAGYGPSGLGVGGTVTQTTNKTNSVTLNTVCGQITLAAGALAAGAVASFTLANSLGEAGDVLIVNHAGGGTSGAYIFFVSAAPSGGFAGIGVRNVTAGSLNEQPVCRFLLLKGVTS